MKLDLKKLGDQAIESSTTAKKMRLSDNAASMVFQLFTKNVYSNPIGTVVREITSNCFDSHTEAKTNNPVLIKKHEDKTTGTHYISFIDFGVGMSPDRVENIYGVYFESTKRDTDDQIGGFGIGGKTPLAYKRSTGQGEGEYDNSFYVITTFDGIKYSYCIYEGTESPIIALLGQEETTDVNGTEVRIPVLEKDLNSFANEMVRQLYYFENIVFEGFEDQYNGEKLTNDYQIVRGQTFLFRGGDYNSRMHVCLGRVAYPIDYSTLGLDSDDYNLPIAIKVPIGKVGVTVNRETLDYSESSIKLLKKLLDDAKAEIIAMISKQYSNIVTLEQYFKVKNDFGMLEFPNNITLFVGNLIKQKDVDFTNFKYSFLKMPTDKELFNFFINTKTFGKKPKKKNRYSTDIVTFDHHGIVNNHGKLVYCEDNFNRKLLKQSYLKSLHETYHILTKRTIASKEKRSEIADLFRASVDEIVNDKNEFVPVVAELLDMQDEYMDLIRTNCINYDTLEVPEEFILSRKRSYGITPEMRKSTIPCKFVGGYAKDRVKLSVLFDYNMPIFYGTAEDGYKLKNAVELYKLLFHKDDVVQGCDYYDGLSTRNDTNNSVAFIMISKGNVQYMEYCKKAQPIDVFYNTMLQRKWKFVNKYFKLREVVEKYNSLNSFYREGYINKIDESWGEKVDEVKNVIVNLNGKYKSDRLTYHKSMLSRHFNLNTKPSITDNIFMKKLNSICDLQKSNSQTLTYFNMPWDASKMDEDFITIVNLTMKL